MVCKRILITGRVQGVSFRYHTLQVATKLNLLGFVRNLEDGRVEAVAFGPEEKVNELIAWARKGPLLARVDHLEIIEIKDGFPKEPFEIRRD